MGTTHKIYDKQIYVPNMQRGLQTEVNKIKSKKGNDYFEKEKI